MLEELVKKSQGLIEYGPTFSLMEPYFILTTIGLYEYYKASKLSIKDPLVLGSRMIPDQFITAAEVQLAAEMAYRVAVAPQPGVRYAVSGQNQVINVPGVGPVPVLQAIQIINSLPQDEVINLLALASAGTIEAIQLSKDAMTAAYCKDCKHCK